MKNSTLAAFAIWLLSVNSVMKSCRLEKLEKRIESLEKQNVELRRQRDAEDSKEQR